MRFYSKTVFPDVDWCMVPLMVQDDTCSSLNCGKGFRTCDLLLESSTTFSSPLSSAALELLGFLYDSKYS